MHLCVLLLFVFLHCWCFFWFCVLCSRVTLVNSVFVKTKSHNYTSHLSIFVVGYQQYQQQLFSAAWAIETSSRSTANNWKIAETERSSVDAKTSRWMMLRRHCQAVHSRSCSGNWKGSATNSGQFERRCNKTVVSARSLLHHFALTSYGFHSLNQL